MCGLTLAGSPPARATAQRTAARSTTAGTPVKSCISTRDGMNAIAGSPFGRSGHAGQRGHVVLAHVAGAGPPEQVLQQDLHRVRHPADVAADPLLRQPSEPMHPHGRVRVASSARAPSAPSWRRLPVVSSDRLRHAIPQVSDRAPTRQPQRGRQDSYSAGAL